MNNMGLSYGAIILHTKACFELTSLALGLFNNDLTNAHITCARLTGVDGLEVLARGPRWVAVRQGNIITIGSVRRSIQKLFAMNYEQLGDLGEDVLDFFVQGARKNILALDMNS